ncbi:hypothetical protein [Streptomyces sp. NPDC005407]|uniref:hypothetical protein n=1 Tax=Streptomyces sp. NPDC005407 TaxID=3155340 RepID=UPI0033B9EAE7
MSDIEPTGNNPFDKPGQNEEEQWRCPAHTPEGRRMRRLRHGAETAFVQGISTAAGTALISLGTLWLSRR